MKKLKLYLQFRKKNRLTYYLWLILFKIDIFYSEFMSHAKRGYILAGLEWGWKGAAPLEGWNYRKE